MLKKYLTEVPGIKDLPILKRGISYERYIRRKKQSTDFQL